MNLLVIDDNYPSATNLYGDVFAHVRIKQYLKFGHDVTVAARFSTREADYEFEGVRVRCVGSMAELARFYDALAPDVTLVHFATFPIIKDIILKNPAGKFIVWVHGYEALGWYRRLFNLKININFLRYIKENTVQLFHFRRLVKQSNRSGRIALVFVSEWMRGITETDCAVRARRAHIIPNPIDVRTFPFREKTRDDRKSLLMIRPFGSRKYATDIVTGAMQILRDQPFFRDLRFSIHGSGAADSDLARLFSGCPNVSISEGFKTQTQIAELHASHGIFLTPTRQDAQGVSMCEAMASGLVPISSKNTAIPEFIVDGESGLLIDNNPEALAAAVVRLYHDPDLFVALSRQASHAIGEKAGIDKVIAAELALIDHMVKM